MSSKSTVVSSEKRPTTAWIAFLTKPYGLFALMAAPDTGFVIALMTPFFAGAGLRMATWLLVPVAVVTIAAEALLLLLGLVVAIKALLALLPLETGAAVGTKAFAEFEGDALLLPVSGEACPGVSASSDSGCST
jgi:hypothetical protein